MKGFFNKTETISTTRPDGKILSCVSCGAYKNCKNPKMEPSGKNEKKIMIIGPGVSEKDDQAGVHLLGSIGNKLHNILKKHNIDLLEDCILLNATRCVTTEKGEYRNPNNYEIQCCRKFIVGYIEKYKPRLIILIGYEAVFAVIGHRWKKDLGKIDKWRGWTIPDQDFKCWICPIQDPKFIDPMKRPEMYTIWKQDIENAIFKLHLPIVSYPAPTIEILTPETLPKLAKITDSIAFDYETTGLKPHKEGHEIICASVATSINFAYVFLIPKSKKEIKPFIDLLSNPAIGKIAQNMKFEDSWTKVRLNVDVANWEWDTMLATHIMDNRSEITGLKFQTYVQFGIVDYDSEISPYLRATNEDNANEINRIKELFDTPNGIDKLLKYCALDSIYEFRLAYLQKAYIELPF